MFDVVVIGGGASGLVSAINLARKGYKVTILEKNNKCGKKLLITGNGKCNYFNEDFTIKHYRSNNIDILENYITLENKNKILSFFDSIGIIPRIKNGYYYPYSNLSVTILNSLLLECNKLNINIINDIEVVDIKCENNIFNIITNKDKYKTKKLVMATGSCANAKTGSDGFGYSLLKKLGHSLIKPLPALVQLVGNESYFKDWTGIRCDAFLTLYENNKEISSETGELQFTNYGISGICIMNLSGRISKGLDKGYNEEIGINFLPFLNKSDIYEWINSRNNNIPNRTIIELLESVINYKLLYIILKKTNINNVSWSKLNEQDRNKLINNLIDFRLKIIDTKGYDNAQVCTGGIPLSEVKNNFESKLIDNLYITGELLDVDGDCGGYNLGFAWLSGLIVGDNND